MSSSTDWYKVHPGKKAEHDKKYLLNHIEEIRKYRQQYYLLNKERIDSHNMTEEQRIEHNRKRRERHARQPEVRNTIERIRDHQKRAYGSLTREVWLAVCEKYADTCIYCGSKERITIEHLTPVSRGGTNEASNLAPACLSCNSSKRNKTYKEYMVWLIN